MDDSGLEIVSLVAEVVCIYSRGKRFLVEFDGCEIMCERIFAPVGDATASVICEFEDVEINSGVLEGGVFVFNQRPVKSLVAECFEEGTRIIFTPVANRVPAAEFPQNLWTNMLPGNFALMLALYENAA